MTNEPNEKPQKKELSDYVSDTSESVKNSEENLELQSEDLENVSGGAKLQDPQSSKGLIVWV